MFVLFVLRHPQKPEVHDISQRHQRRSEPRPWINMHTKFGEGCPHGNNCMRFGGGRQTPLKLNRPSRHLFTSNVLRYHHHHHHHGRVAGEGRGEGRRDVAPPCPRPTARLQSSPIGRVKSFRSWSNHLFRGRPDGRRHVRPGGRLSDTLMWS